MVHSAAAVRTVAVNTAHPGNSNSRSDRKLGRATIGDLCNDLMIENQVVADRRQVPFDIVKIHPADATGDHSKPKIARLDSGLRNVLEFKKRSVRPLGAGEYGCFRVFNTPNGARTQLQTHFVGMEARINGLS